VLGRSHLVSIVPWGFRKMLGYVQQRYLKHTGLPLLITENGFSIKNEAKMTKEECLNDVERVNYYEGYLRELASAVKDDGLNCIAYFGWTIAE
jgi:beta-glucosidase